MPASPSQQKPKPDMDFYEALRIMVEQDKMVSRREWSANEYGLLKSGRVTIHLKDDQDHDWIITDGDTSATDWVIYNPQ